MRVRWEDGHQGFYPYELLRGHCPCATCQGHFQPSAFHVVKGAVLERVELVGNYALGMRWIDGHDTGIYSFRKLRDLCPCRECRPDGVEELRLLGLEQE